jgi:hypothetical protein
MSGRERGEWKLNDDDRRQWIDNNEGLYLWHRRTGLSVRAFIRANREEIDAIIRDELGPKKPSWQSGG